MFRGISIGMQFRRVAVILRSLIPQNALLNDNSEPLLNDSGEFLLTDEEKIY